jgi:DDE superfamily endonuclease
MDGFEAYLSIDLIDYVERHKIILCYMPPHASHLVQPLDIGLFGLFAHAYKEEVSKRYQFGLTKVSKSDYLEILHIARQKAYTEQNIAGAWRGSGIEPFDIAKIERHAFGRHHTTPKKPIETIHHLKTPETTREIDAAIERAIGTTLSPTMAIALRKIAKAGKTAMEGYQLLQYELEMRARSAIDREKKEKKKAVTEGGLIITSEIAAQLREKANWKAAEIEKDQRHKKAFDDRLYDLKRHGLFLNRKNCPRHRLVILPTCWRPYLDNDESDDIIVLAPRRDRS